LLFIFIFLYICYILYHCRITILNLNILLSLNIVFQILCDQIEKKTLHWNIMDQSLDVLTTQTKCGKNAHVDKCDSGNTGVLDVMSTSAMLAGYTLW
jgi:hypothetical protein